MATEDPIIEVEQLSYTYAEGQSALTDIRFQAYPGECVGIVGPNGAGKTTFFLCLSGVLKRLSGRLKVAGLDPGKSSDRRKLPLHLGIVFQDADDQIFNATVFDDVAFGPLNLELPEVEVRARVSESLARVQLNGYEDRVPFHLSGGEKRRVALAGALAMRPEILLFDEPSVHLDPRSRRGLIHLIQSLTVTRLIASHDLEMIVETCARCLLLDQGRIVAEGATRELLSDGALMEVHGLEVPYSLR